MPRTTKIVRKTSENSPISGGSKKKLPIFLAIVSIFGQTQFYVVAQVSPVHFYMFSNASEVKKRYTLHFDKSEKHLASKSSKI